MRYDRERVKAGADIATIVLGYLPLRSVSRVRRVAPCPFHHEKTASFSVSTDRQRFHCFGCEADGDVFDFVQRIEGLSGFTDAVRRVAELAGIPPESGTVTPEDRDRWNRARAAAPDLAAEIADWAHGLRLLAEARKRQLVDVLQWAWQEGADTLAESIGERISRLPITALLPEQASPRLVAGAYVRTCRTHPEAARRVMEYGRADRMEAERITSLIVDMLADSKEARGLAA
ncbi:MAG: dnaG [Bryobacterales bacterium]|nr:dnaG [Bryobacterales bacterium]